ncbi:MotA/TolQ/ExbB proton channel family protein [Nitratidesulfovibrio sp. D1]|uniref:MotA/TolQ/ExbB proton channel family protein n=1 Tax=Nitratidesulfovibrio sp. D1 TaxID=3440151 RepID=UPI003EBC2D0C
MTAQLWNALAQATPVAKAVLGILLFMSLASWAYMCGKWLCLRAAHARNKQGIDRFDAAPDLAGALDSLRAGSCSPLQSVALRGLREFNRIARTGDVDRLLNNNVRRALRQGVAEEMARLSSSLSLLASVANTAPFIGLFGTVWGIMHSFHNIGTEKSAALATVAPGISEALIATAVGLFVAIPATLGYNTFLSRLGNIEAQCINFAGMFLNRVEHEAERHPQGLDTAGMGGQ